jgi:hypothetical protein
VIHKAKDETNPQDFGLEKEDKVLGIGDWGLGIGDWGLGRIKSKVKNSVPC